MKKELIRKLKREGYSNKEIIDVLSTLGIKVSRSTIYRNTRDISTYITKSTLPSRYNVSLLPDFGYIYRGENIFSPDLGLSDGNGGCSNGQIPDSVLDGTQGAHDDQLSGMSSHVYYPTLSRGSGLKSYLKAERDDNSKMKYIGDWKSVKCEVCGWNVPESELENGMCPECHAEYIYGVDYAPVQKYPKKPKFDDERDGE